MNGDCERYTEKYLREIDGLMATLFGSEAKPLCRYFVRRAISPIIDRLLIETAEIHDKHTEVLKDEIRKLQQFLPKEKEEGK